MVSRVIVRAAALTAALAWAAACAPAGVRPGAPEGVPGFDTRRYPGDAAMARWRADSPYRWVGYYITAACHPRSSWSGRRSALHAMGWGLAVLYVGEQDWTQVANPPTGPGATGGVPRCTAANLTAERGLADAAEADSVARAEGFPVGSTVYLNVERVDAVTPALETYVRTWAGALVDRGRFAPGLYAHAGNADELYAAMADELVRRSGRPPRLWVAKAGGFHLSRSPAESGFPRATIWQGVFDATETWGEVTLRIDANVATTPSPS
jgi:hypothetical protein